MRNVAFSILLTAIALLQIAVVAAELSHSSVQTVAAAKQETGARVVVAKTETVRKSF